MSRVANPDSKRRCMSAGVYSQPINGFILKMEICPCVIGASCIKQQVISKCESPAFVRHHREVAEIMRAIPSGQAIFFSLGLLTGSFSALGQPLNPSDDQRARLVDLQATLKEKGVAEKAAARAWARGRGIPFRSELANGKVLELQRLGPGGPVFYQVTFASSKFPSC